MSDDGLSGPSVHDILLYTRAHPVSCVQSYRQRIRLRRRQDNIITITCARKACVYCTAHVNLPQPPTRRLRNRGGGDYNNTTTSAVRACASSPLYANVMHHRGTHIDDVSEHLGCSCATGCRVRQNIVYMRVCRPAGKGSRTYDIIRMSIVST